MKIMVLIDARVLPVAFSTTSASPHESKHVQPLFDFILSEESPQRLIGDKAQDGRPIRRYRRRWKVERTIS